MTKPAHLPHDRVVAFIDILGFEDLVGEMNDREIYDTVRDALKDIPMRSTSFVMALRGDLTSNDMPQGMQVAHFSDSIVISADMSTLLPDTAAELVLMLSQFIVTNLFRRGILVRGGIAQGWTFHRGNILFGKGVIDAFKLEKQAHMPRVLVADSIVSLLTRTSRHQLCVDSDGFRFIDMFASGFTVHDLGQRIREWLRKYESRVEVYVKYRWLAVLFNRLLKERKNQAPWAGAEPIILPGDEEAPSAPPPAPPGHPPSGGAPAS